MWEEIRTSGYDTCMVTDLTMFFKILHRNQRPVYVQSYHHPPSKLANKENEQKAKAVSKPFPPSSATQKIKPLETNI